MYFIVTGVSGNGPPELLEDVDNLVVSESMPVGTLVTTVKASDPEGSPVHFGIVGTDRFSVDKDTGEIRVAQPLDREVKCNLYMQYMCLPIPRDPQIS